MKNITITLDEDLIEQTRRYAAARGLSVSAMIKELLERNVVRDSRGDWLARCFAHMDKASPKRSAGKWKRDELYDV